MFKFNMKKIINIIGCFVIKVSMIKMYSAYKHLPNMNNILFYSI